MKRPNFGKSTIAKLGISSAIAAALPLIVTTGWIQSVSAVEIEEIVVSAERREASLQDTPIAISAFSADQLDRVGVTAAKELHMITPGLIVDTAGPTTNMFLRGVGARLSGPGFEPSIATYIDDRYVARSTNTNVDFVDLERVEVLKGPQGTFIGRNAAGGAVRFITKNPTDEVEGMVKVVLGNYDYRQVSGVFNTPLRDGAEIRLAIQKADRDYYADQVVNQPGLPKGMDDQDNLTIRAKLSWDITDRVNLLLTQSYYERDESRGQWSVDVAPSGYSLYVAPNGPGVTGDQSRRKTGQSLDQNSKTEEWSTQAVFNISFDSFDLVSTTVYSDASENVLGFDSDGTSLKASDVIVLSPFEDFSQELRVQSNTDTDLSWVAGLYYYEEEAGYDVALDVGAPLFLSLGDNTVDTKSKAVFGQFDWRFAPNWTLILGGRYTFEEKSVHMVASPRHDVGATLIGPLPYSADEDWNEFTPRATLQYEFDEQMVYVTYARGFKSGGFNYPLLTAGVPQPVLDPEILDMFEIGAKGSLFENQLRYDASLYYYDYKDLQVTRGLSGSQVVTENAADAEILGLDLSLEWLATDNWLLTMGLSILDTEYKDYMASARTFAGTPGTIVIPFDADGHDMINAPKQSFTLSSRYEFNLDQGIVPVVISYSYKGEFYYDFVTDPQTRIMKDNGYGVLNARIDYVSESEDWKVGIWGKNLTDKEYFHSVQGTPGNMRGLISDPRTFGVEFQFNF